MEEIISKFSSDYSNVAKTQIDSSHYQSKNKSEGFAQVEYTRIMLCGMTFLLK